LALAHALGDMGGEDLGAEGLAEDDLVDRLGDDLLEARHVNARLARVEVDEALELGVVEVLAGIRLDADHLLDASHPDAGEADLRAGHPGLHVGGGARKGRRLSGHRVPKVSYVLPSPSLYSPVAGALGPVPREGGEGVSGGFEIEPLETAPQGLNQDSADESFASSDELRGLI